MKRLRTDKWKPPATWEQQWDGIAAMRAQTTAPVDVAGCGVLHDPDAAPSVQRFQTLVALMLSSQTKDETTAVAMGNLKQWGLTPEHVASADEDTIDALIAKVGFHRTKAGYLRLAAQRCLELYAGDIPRTADEAMELRGVGPKMAHLLMLHAWGQCEGIGVDTHVHRISQRLGWTRGAKTPEDTRRQLEDWLPREKWPLVNHLLVGHGQTVCFAKTPACDTCNIKHLCPSSTYREAKPQNNLKNVTQ